MHKFNVIQSKSFIYSCLCLLVIFVIIVLFVQHSEADGFPSDDEIPASIYGESHGSKTKTSMRIGAVSWSQTYAHSHALVYAHWTRRGFYEVTAYTGPAGMFKIPIVSKRKDEKTEYFRAGYRETAEISEFYHLIRPDRVLWIASYLIWDQTGARIGQVNYQGLGYPLEDDMNLPEDDIGDAGGSGTIRLASTTGYEVTIGSTHEVIITTDLPYYYIILAITSPGQTEPDTVVEIFDGDGTTTEAKSSYTFSEDSDHGEYVITVYVFTEKLDLVTESYNINVLNNANSGSINQDEGTDSPITPTYIADTSTRTFVSTNGKYYTTVDSIHEAKVTSSVPYESIHWQVKDPDHTGHLIPFVQRDPGTGTLTEATLRYTIPADATTGIYKIMAYVWYSDLSARQLSYDLVVTHPLKD